MSFATEPLSVGHAQSWQDMSADRVSNVTYINTTGRAILCSYLVYENVQYGLTSFYINGEIVSQGRSYETDGTNTVITHSVIVPADSSYKFVSSNGGILWELR